MIKIVCVKINKIYKKYYVVNNVIKKLNIQIY
jgi:hypothetical protein